MLPLTTDIIADIKNISYFCTVHCLEICVQSNFCFWTVKGMDLVRELEKDLKVATVICMVRIWMHIEATMCMNYPYSVSLLNELDLQNNMHLWSHVAVVRHVTADSYGHSCSLFQNGRRHLTSSMNEVSRDLIVNSNSKKKQALLVFSSSHLP